MTLIQPVNGFRQGHFFICHSSVSPCKYSVSEIAANSDKEIRRMQTEFKWEQDKAQKKLDDTMAENRELETEERILQMKNSRLQTEYYEAVDKLTDKKNEIEIAEKRG